MRAAVQLRSPLPPALASTFAVVGALLMLSRAISAANVPTVSGTMATDFKDNGALPMENHVMPHEGRT